MKADAQRVICLGLDAFEISLAESMISVGRLPHLKQIAERSARFRLDHDSGKFTGLAWEHFSTGRSPDNQKRWSAVTFDPSSYAVEQDPTRAEPFAARITCPTVAFDVPYFDLERAPSVLGVSTWGAHDPGVPRFSRPAGLGAELAARYGEYPAPEWLYGFSWPSVAKTKAAGIALSAAVRRRSEILLWLLAERVPNWQLALLVVSETHSAIEQLWHGVDPSHPLHSHPSASHARLALESVYEATDDLVGRVASAFPDAILLLFSMHGMGTNTADVPAMFLAPELMYRHAFGRPYASQAPWPRHLAGGAPIFTEGEGWDKAMRKRAPWPRVPGTALARLRSLLGDKRPLPGRAQASNLGWMPAARYAHFWPAMPVFALPAYYDIQLRLNLVGREATGIVPAERYEQTVGEIVSLFADCRDPVSGGEVIEKVIRREKPPAEIGPSEADIYISLIAGTTGLRHPRLGTIGPVPYRRTGGHTGDWGFLHLSGLAGNRGDLGTADAFDVAPTVIELIGAPPRPDLSGASLLPRIANDTPSGPRTA